MLRPVPIKVTCPRTLSSTLRTLYHHHATKYGMAKNKVKSLSAGRTAIVKHGQAKFSAKKGRSIIRSHHQLSKALVDAERNGNQELVTKLREEIEENGGLATYQQASLLGQSNERGGDSSKVLVDWLKPDMKGREQRLRVLEVGALSTNNACSKWELMDVTRIDLNSQTTGILKQDFMARPLPSSEEDKFEVISLSLVLNFVPSKEGRGDMLKRACQFLSSKDPQEMLPCLFLVLPAPCVENSRYMTEERLEQIMGSLGYAQKKRKLSSKLIYGLWIYRPLIPPEGGSFGKVEVNAGKTRNNFSIVV